MTHPLGTSVRMDAAAVVGLVWDVDRTRACASAGRDELAGAMGAAERAITWLQAAQADMAGRLAACTSFPQADIAAATRTSVRDADRLVERAGVLEAAPAFAEALGDARVTAAHVDAFGRSLRSLEPAHRDQLLDRVEQLAVVAEQATVEEFTRRLRMEARRITADDGVARLERQRRDGRLRTWTDPITGMWRLDGRFDPVTGLRLAGRLDNTIAALFADTTPDTCPTDPGEKQDHLRALALAAITEGRPSGSGRAEITVVVDTTGTDPATGGPLIDWGHPIDLPTSVLHDLWPTANVATVVVDDGLVVDAPGNLNPGRTARVANRDQRRALNALYRGCAIPGCQVRYRYCKLHHIRWWDHHGTTNLNNLLPVCERHHHAIHDHGWQIRLGPRRQLTLDLPDGTRSTTGPPQRGREPITKTVRASQGPAP